MRVYRIRMAIQSLEKELYEIDYSLSEKEIRKHGSNIFIPTENLDVQTLIPVKTK